MTMIYQVWRRQSAGRRANKTDREGGRERENLWTNDWICDQMNVRQEVSY